MSANTVASQTTVRTAEVSAGESESEKKFVAEFNDVRARMLLNRVVEVNAFLVQLEIVRSVFLNA